MDRRRRTLILTGVVVVGLALLPVVRNRISAAATLLEALGMSVPRPFAPNVKPETAEVGGVTGRLYKSGDYPAVLVVPGATPDGVEDARVNDLARALARAGRTVFIPDLDLYREQFTKADLERIVAAVGGLAESSGRPVAVLGISYGGSFSLVAAADDRMEGRLSRVATLGAYYDLEGVIQAVTTGGSTVDDRFIPWEGHPIAGEVLATRTAELLPEEEQKSFLAALDGRLDIEHLAPSSRALYDLLANDDPWRTSELAERLHPSLRSLIEAFSPSQVADEIGVPVLALHSIDDPLVPYAELIRLEAGMPQAEILTVRLFRHVDFDPSSPSGWWSLIPDMWKVWHFTTWILAG
ncbi:MAG: alpha/beta fold hydrolase [Acidobacteria bacterium]|nr:alpha/beta fold hydrolase [Acidobacteriota bacterium]